MHIAQHQHGALIDRQVSNVALEQSGQFSLLHDGLGTIAMSSCQVMGRLIVIVCQFIE